jgi:hypothetical protein
MFTKKSVYLHIEDFVTENKEMTLITNAFHRTYFHVLSTCEWTGDAILFLKE